MEITSSAEVRPASTLRTPSSRKRAHAEFARALAQNKSRAAFVDHVPDFVVDHENLEDAHSPLVTGVAALVAADRLHDLRFAQLPGSIRNARNSVSLSSAGLFAIRAKSPDESLRHDRAHGGGDEKRLHADIDQARHGRRRVVRVQRAENEVTGQAGVGGDASPSRDRESHRS